MRFVVVFALIVVALAKSPATGCICTENHLPVICADGETYSNSCIAQCAGQKSCSPASDSCVCTKEYAPVVCADGIKYSNMCNAKCAGGTENTCVIDDADHAAEVQKYLDAEKQKALLAKQQAADEAAAKKAAQDALEAKIAAEQAAKDAQGTTGAPEKVHSYSQPNGRTLYKYGDVSNFHCQDITGHRTDEAGVLHIGTALNPLEDDSASTCDGTSGLTASKVNVCCPASCESCDDSDSNCAIEGGSLCCAKDAVASQRVCSSLQGPPCKQIAKLDRSIRIEKEYAAAFQNATKICFNAYGFYCQRVTKKIVQSDYLNFVTPMNSHMHDAIRLPVAAPHVSDMTDVARVCFVPDPLPDSQLHLTGKQFRQRDDWDNPIIASWRTKYGIYHPDQGTGYAYESDERWNSWPSYKRFLPETGCCRICSVGKPCGKSCISKTKNCTKEPGVHDWCACDKQTADKLELIKQSQFKRSPPDFQGWPYTYPEGYSKHTSEYEASRTSKYETFDTHHAAKFDERGRLMPTQKIDYSPSTTTACCRTACATKYAAKDQEEMKDCVEGCDLWVSKSSLNWDDKKWWSKLETRCTNDCVNIDVWKAHGETKDDYYGRLRTPSNENICSEGCSFFHKCMINGGDAQQATGTAAVVTSNEMLNTVHDSDMCPAGWGILQNINPLKPDGPRTCCHYSCGRCVENCNSEFKHSKGLFKVNAEDDTRSDTLRKDRCCVSKIVQSGLFCDSHQAPCIMPPAHSTSL